MGAKFSHRHNCIHTRVSQEMTHIFSSHTHTTMSLSLTHKHFSTVPVGKPGNIIMTTTEKLNYLLSKINTMFFSFLPQTLVFTHDEDVIYTHLRVRVELPSVLSCVPASLGYADHWCYRIRNRQTK